MFKKKSPEEVYAETVRQEAALKEAKAISLQRAQEKEIRRRNKREQQYLKNLQLHRKVTIADEESNYAFARIFLRPFLKDEQKAALDLKHEQNLQWFDASESVLKERSESARAFTSELAQRQRRYQMLSRAEKKELRRKRKVAKN